MLQNPRLTECSVGRRGIAPASETHLFGLFLSCPVRRIQGIPQTVGKLPQLLLLWLPLHGARSVEGDNKKTEKRRKKSKVCVCVCCVCACERERKTPRSNGSQDLENQI